MKRGTTLIMQGEHNQATTTSGPLQSFGTKPMAEVGDRSRRTHVGCWCQAHGTGDRALGARFDRIFTRKANFVALGRLLASLHATNDEWLMVLNRPEHPNILAPSPTSSAAPC
jgi:hypothetical protein